MTTKSKGRPLPPLLPREYCTIDRAARMLDCEPDDLMHWAEIAAIKFWLKPDNENCGAIFILEHDFQRLQKLIIEQNREPLFHLVSITTGLSTFWLEADCFKDVTFADGDPIALDVNQVEGLWAVEFSDIKYHSNKAEGYFTPQVLYSDSIDSNYFILDLDADMRFDLNELLVIRSDLEKLHLAITSGEQVKSRFNDDNLAEEIQKKENHRQRPMENNSPKKAMALMSLSEYVLRKAELAPELMNRPDALQTAINKELLKNSIPEIEGKTLYGAFQVAITHRKKL